LKRILPILLSVILLTATTTSMAQDSRNPTQGTPVLSTYPNPATSYITFDLQKGFQNGLTIAVFNFLGKKMTERTNVTEKTTLNLNDFTRGVYIYHLINQSGKVVNSGKFQVSR
jgi:hypothetical protein